MKRTQLYIDPATYSLAAWKAKIDGTSISEVVRQSVRVYVQPRRTLKEKKADFLSWLSAYHQKNPTLPGTPTDLGLEHDHYLYGTPKKYTKK